MNRLDLLAWAYPLILWTHVSLVATSGSLFLLRGIGVQLRQTWPLRPACQRLSMVIDSALLVAGASLWWLLQFNPLRDAWLGTKLGLLVVYIVLGTLALKRAPTQGARAVCLVAALLCLAFMASIALNHHPLGWWAPA